MPLEPCSESGTELSYDNSEDLPPTYHGKKVSFSDFPCGVRNDCGHLEWVVENQVSLRWMVPLQPDIFCKLVLGKSRLCFCGHDPELARQAARDVVKDHESAAMRAGARQFKELGKRLVY